MEDTDSENELPDSGIDWDEVRDVRERTGTVYRHFNSTGRDTDDLESAGSSNLPRLETMLLFDGAQITFGESMVLIMATALNFHFPNDALTCLLILIGLHCHKDSLYVASRHAFDKFFSLKNLQFPVTRWKVCSCQRLNPYIKTVCENAECQKDISTSDTLYFLEMPIHFQLQNMCKRKGFCKMIRNSRRKGRQTYEDIVDGRQYQKIKQLQDTKNMSLLMNTDGVRIFKSSNFGIWPIYFTVNELPYHERTKRENLIFAGVWFGISKPKMVAFMEPFARALRNLQKGVMVHPPDEPCFTTKVYLIGCTADLQAKALVMNMKQHNGNFGCPKCKQKGTHSGSKHQWPFQAADPKGPRRTHEETKSHAAAALDANKDVFGIRGPASWLTVVPHFDIIEGMAVDYMHGALLGVTKRLLLYWMSETTENKKQRWYCGHAKSEIDAMLEDIKPPMEVHRRPRSITGQLQHWKASEFRAWLLYYSLPIMIHFLPTDFYEHYTLFVTAIHILLQQSITTDDLDKAEDLLLQFVAQFEVLYGVKEVVCNVHSLVHYADNVRELGPLWAHSCFYFEDLNGQLRHLVHGTNGIVDQLMRAVSIVQKFPEVTRDCFQPGTPAQDYFAKVWKQASPEEKSNYQKIADRCFAVGNLKKDKKDQSGLLKMTHYEAIMQATQQPVLGDLFTYDRMLMKGNMYHSQAYKRVYRHNSYTVMFGEERKVGEVLCYVQHNSKSCSCVDKCECPQRARHYAIINVFQAVPAGENLNDITLQSVPHVNKYTLSNMFEAVALNTLIAKVVPVALDGFIYAAELPNFYEKE
ncbi:uncharacterized protein LOC118415252 isoform X1 [Branchiostoma floridae]|uniref:Uncharacterized protein LOC118415252 isoform X1 n=2 Tax=Branchiostoma floridae TaxID=7739 RepID=A0A9J7L3Y9_BRAFL|nr:uncharacterized protein LOC118415252 isoform X1 [Branchiostoma floridae]